MVKHIILWQLKDSFSADEKQKIASEIKLGLEGLYGKIPGLTEIKVYTSALPSSNADVMLYSVFDDQAALKGYSVNPLHVSVADTKVRPFTKQRVCMDFTD